MAKTELTSKLISRFDRLSGRRQNWETHWQEVADYMLPRKADITKKRSRGDKRMERIFATDGGCKPRAAAISAALRRVLPPSKTSASRLAQPMAHSVCFPYIMSPDLILYIMI